MAEDLPGGAVKEHFFEILNNAVTKNVTLIYHESMSSSDGPRGTVGVQLQKSYIQT